MILKIAFKKYSGHECENVWQGISRNLRRHRLLGEIIEDAEKWATEPWTNYYASKKKVYV